MCNGAPLLEHATPDGRVYHAFLPLYEDTARGLTDQGSRTEEEGQFPYGLHGVTIDMNCIYV